MKIGLLVVSVIGLSVTCTTWASDLPSLGYSTQDIRQGLSSKRVSVGHC